MATQIPIGTAAYLTSFVDGQGVGSADYFTFDADHDTNYKLLRLTINQIIVEISALSGPNAVAALDVVLWDDEDNPITAPEQMSGVVGAASYEVSVEGGGTLKIKKGQAFVSGQRVVQLNTQTGLTSSGGAGTRWVAIDANGAIFIEAAAASKSLDIASVPWNGTIFTGTPTHLADVFFDGDSYAEMRNRPAAGTSFPAVVFRRVSERFEALEQSLSVAVGGASVLAMPPGTAANPGLIQKDGAGAGDTTTGWFRFAADTWAYAVSGVEAFRLAVQGIAGLVGSAGAPPFTFIPDPDTGLYRPADNIAGLAGGGELSVEGGSIAAGGVGLPNLLRCKATKAAAQNISSSTTPTVLDFDTEAYDVGGWHESVTNPDRFTCPSNGDGNFEARLHVVFDESTSATPNVGDREVRITLAGAEVESVKVPAASVTNEDTKIVIPVDLDLVATDILRGEAAQDSGNTMDVIATFVVKRAA